MNCIGSIWRSMWNMTLQIENKQLYNFSLLFLGSLLEFSVCLQDNISGKMQSIKNSMRRKKIKEWSGLRRDYVWRSNELLVALVQKVRTPLIPTVYLHWSKYTNTNTNTQIQGQIWETKLLCKAEEDAIQIQKYFIVNTKWR